MQDRFKFRTFFNPSYQEPEMIYDSQLSYDFGCTKSGSWYHDSFAEVLEDKTCITMQCTGLKDKNGKLIYEGDIVTDTHVPLVFQIEWEQEYCRFVQINHHKDECFVLEDTTYKKSNHTLEIIGNIYENHELLESEE